MHPATSQTLNAIYAETGAAARVKSVTSKTQEE
jgi:hypothetical protein